MADIAIDSNAESLQTLAGPRLHAVAALWKQQRRSIITSFGGFSMLPTISPGTPLEILCDEEARPGDVIVFVHRSEVVVHRLLAVRGKWMLTRGDGNDLPDLPEQRSAMLGRAVGSRRGAALEPVPVYRESRRQAFARRIAAASFALGSTAARATIAAMRRFYGMTSKTLGAWRLYGVRGFFARVWSKTLGVFFDVEVILTGRFQPPEVFTPVTGYRYERVAPDSHRFAEAAKLLKVDAAKRLNQHAYVAIDEASDTVAACTFADQPAGNLGFNRGGTADARHRGRSLTGSILMYQATLLEAEGIRDTEYHVNLTNRGARRMHRKIGAREVDCWVVLVFFRRFRITRRFAFASPRIPNPG